MSSTQTRVRLEGGNVDFNHANIDDEWSFLTISFEQDGNNIKICADINDSSDVADCRYRNGRSLDTIGECICLGDNGNSFTGHIKDLTFYDSPISIYERNTMFQNGGCTANGGACNFCDLTGVCYNGCDPDTFGAGCTACDVTCQSCFGADYESCFSCIAPEFFVYAATTCNSCGNGHRFDAN